jgi:hypothetical protein
MLAFERLNLWYNTPSTTTSCTTYGNGEERRCDRKNIANLVFLLSKK